MEIRSSFPFRRYGGEGQLLLGRRCSLTTYVAGEL